MHIRLWEIVPPPFSFRVLFVEGSEKDRRARSRHVIRLLQKTALRIEDNHKFADITIVLEINGVKTAEGSFPKTTVPHGIPDGLEITR